MDRLFLDANILFSAARTAESRVLWFWHRKDIRLLTSQYAVEEARRNLAFTDLRGRLDTLIQSIEIVSTPVGLPDIERLPDARLPKKDQPILAAAIKSGATHLITGDKKHFSHYFGQRVCGVLIQTPAQYRWSKTEDE